MSELRINILDANRAVNGTLHGSMADAILAGLTAEPDNIEELEKAMTRYAKPTQNERFLARFSAGVNENPWDAGIIFVDLAARIFAAESSYSILLQEGEVQYHNGRKMTDVWLPYQVGPDWLFLDSVEQYKAVADQRRAEWAAVQPLDSRPILYGAIEEFIAKECCAARASKKEDPIAEIHAKWLMMPRNDLCGLPPREALLLKREQIDRDLWSRELQWSRLKEPAPCLSKNSRAYQFAGFGTHEIVIYYNLVRMLITDCWERMGEGKEITMPDEIARLGQLKAEWLAMPDPEYGGKSPAAVIENERIRLPWLMSGEDSPFEDDECPCCQAMAQSEFEPGFWHLDGCNMDDDYPFSFFRTQEEWEADRLRFEEIAESIRQRKNEGDPDNVH